MSLCSKSFQYSAHARAVQLGPCNCTHLSKAGMLEFNFKYMRKLSEVTVTSWVLIDGKQGGR